VTYALSDEKRIMDFGRFSTSVTTSNEVRISTLNKKITD